MIISADKSSSDYWGFYYANAPAVFLDGELIVNVTLADEASGCVVALRYDTHGQPVIHEGRHCVTVYNGKVEIKPVA